MDGRDLRLSNLNKVFWPDEGYTKGDLLAYYWNIADLIGPHLEGRPLTGCIAVRSTRTTRSAAGSTT